jgi:nucleotide-binding universal stress UspA family protein
VPNDGLNLRAERGVKSERHVVTGEQVDEISLLAKEGKCNLIVVGHRRHESLLSPLWTGLLGASLIEERPRSVLIAKVLAEAEVAPALVCKP